MNRKLYRSVREKKVCGLIGGIGEWLGWDVTLMRILFVIGAVFSGLTLVVVYLLVSMVVPKSPYPLYGPLGYGGYPEGPDGYSANDRGYSNGPRAANPTNPYASSYEGMKQANNYDVSYTSANDCSIDSMMIDIENKALKKELEELRQKMAKYERGDE